MIPFERNRQQTIPSSSLKVIGLGGAGANMLDRAALDGMEGAELLALNTDMRTLAQSVAGEKLQLGPNLTKGLGAGGDPELGKQAVLEVEAQVRDAVKGRSIVFLCVGLGGGTGSGAAPIVTRLAREEGAFVVVFATMPFGFEGQRRRDQAETALNELAVLSNALVTFDNGRMGELVLAKQGIHEAFSAADRMISESIKAVTRLVIKPGLVNVGLDDLMTALKTNRSRCLFGSGIAKGKNRAQTALKNALSSPLLDRGSLLHDAESVLVHVSGGSEMTLYEVELLMQGLTKHVPESAHILFGAAIDEAMGDSLSVTVISALPENKLTATMPGKTEGAADSIFEAVEDDDDDEEVDPGGTFVPAVSFKKSEPEPEVEDELEEEPEPEPVPEKKEKSAPKRTILPPRREKPKSKPEPEPEPEPEPVIEGFEEDEWDEEEDEEIPARGKVESPFLDDEDEEEDLVEDEDSADEEVVSKEDDDLEDEDANDDEDSDDGEVVRLTSGADKSKSEPKADELGELEDDDWATVHKPKSSRKDETGEAKKRPSAGQAELELDGGPRGRFEGESPNLVDGEDLDVPPYLRKRAK
ncbi:cell division protein FtsZ [Roseibacillus persicicus]|uniref:cell division protein FtsZ n=1 Tax=Roseibacillus persicicus TaxID=454148 RepID=UPI00398A5619